MFAAVVFIVADFPPFITASVPPVLQPLTDAQTPADGFLASASNTGNYASTAGTISTAVREVSINGGAFTTTLSQDLIAGDIVAGRVVVTDSASNVRTFVAGTVTVTAAAASGIGTAAIGTTFQVG